MASKWIEQVFAALQTARSGGIVRRKKSSVAKYATIAELLKEAKARGHHVIETDHQFVVICNSPSYRYHF